MKACLDVIHEIGHNVKVTYKTVPETEVMSLDKAVNYFAMRLHNNTWGDIEDMKVEIRNLIEPLAINGEIHNKTVDKVAWVSWSVKQEGSMTVDEKRKLELKTMYQIIGIYCHNKHHTPKAQLCEECQKVWQYA